MRVFNIIKISPPIKKTEKCKVRNKTQKGKSILEMGSLPRQQNK
jgi:hypothetical protein